MPQKAARETPLLIAARGRSTPGRRRFDGEKHYCPVNSSGKWRKPKLGAGLQRICDSDDFKINFRRSATLSSFSVGGDSENSRSQQSR